MKKQTKRRPFHIDVSKWHSNNSFNFTKLDHAIIACASKQVTKNQIESCRKIISRFSRRFKPRPKYKLYFNYSILLTKKSLGARMGRGKGAVKGYYAKVCKNDLLFGFNNCKAYVIRTLINRLKYKMPFKLKLVSLFKNGYCRSEDRCRW